MSTSTVKTQIQKFYKLQKGKKSTADFTKVDFGLSTSFFWNYLEYFGVCSISYFGV